MRIGFVELVLLLFIASITVGPNVALFVDRWLRRAQRTSAAAARRKAQLEAQAAIEREALMTRFRVASAASISRAKMLLADRKSVV